MRTQRILTGLAMCFLVTAGVYFDANSMLQILPTHRMWEACFFCCWETCGDYGISLTKRTKAISVQCCIYTTGTKYLRAGQKWVKACWRHTSMLAEEDSDSNDLSSIQLNTFVGENKSYFLKTSLKFNVSSTNIVKQKTTTKEMCNIVHIWKYM